VEYYSKTFVAENTVCVPLPGVSHLVGRRSKLSTTTEDEMNVVRDTSALVPTVPDRREIDMKLTA